MAAGTADLLGRMTPLHGPVDAPEAECPGHGREDRRAGEPCILDVSQGVDLGPAGMVHVSGRVTSFIVGEDLLIDGGRVIFDRDVTTAISVGGDLGIMNNGLLVVGRDLGTAQTAGPSTLVTRTGSTSTTDAGTGTSQSNTTSTVTTQQGTTPTAGGGRRRCDAVQRRLDPGGPRPDPPRRRWQRQHRGRGPDPGRRRPRHLPGRWDVPGALGSPSRPPDQRDLFVALTLGVFRVSGGGFNQPSVDRVDVEVGKNIQGLDVAHGIFNSSITAGVLIDGGDPATGQSNIGPDAFDVILNTEIRAGVQITNLTLGGDVRSDHVRNPGNRQTRIVAGEDRQGNFISGGNILGLKITGSLIDAVVAASVKPNGGNGQLAAAVHLRQRTGRRRVQHLRRPGRLRRPDPRGLRRGTAPLHGPALRPDPGPDDRRLRLARRDRGDDGGRRDHHHPSWRRVRLRRVLRQRHQRCHHRRWTRGRRLRAQLAGTVSDTDLRATRGVTPLLPPCPIPGSRSTYAPTTSTAGRRTRRGRGGPSDWA